MEVSVRTKCIFPSTASSAWAKQMLSEDPPLFDDEVAEEYRPVFHAFEDSALPESFRFSGKKVLILDWTLGSGWLDEIAPLLKSLMQIDDMKLFTCALEDEAGVLIINDKMANQLDTSSLAYQAGIKVGGGFGWVNKLFVFLEKSQSTNS